MNLCLPGMDVTPVRAPEDFGQWWTPMPIAHRMVAWCGTVAPHSVLEPSCGIGNIVQAVRDRWQYAQIEAVELDPSAVDKARGRFFGDTRTHIYRGSFLDTQPIGEDHDLCVMNPPYEGGADGLFLARAMDLSRRVVALIRLQALAGQARHEAVWSRCKPDGDYVLRGVAIFAGRPRFESGSAIGDREDGGSAKADFCVVKLSRRTDDEIGRDVPTQVEWW